MNTETSSETAAPETETAITFASFNLPQPLAQALERMKYIHPTPVQAKAIPSAMEGKDVLGSAQTGTGKTGAFCIPLVAKMLREAHSKAIIMAPTRELAAQTLTVLKQLIGNNRDIKTALLIGGESMGRQFDQLRNKPRIIVGTPGRINDHLRRAPSMLEGTDLVVLDEADRMLDMGFSVQIDTIIEKTDPTRQTLMFSATFPDEILKFAKRYLTDPVRVSVNPKQVSADNIKHDVLHTSIETKYDDLVQQLSNRNGTIIVFVKTKHGADKLTKRLQREDHDAAVIHGGLKQRQRDRVIQAFRDYKTRILIATDVAARGLDVPHIEHVINYDLPQNPEDYIHRIGRTARAGAEGSAVAFVLPSERGAWNVINRILNPGAKPERHDGKYDRKDGGKRFEGKKGGFKNKYKAGRNPWENKPRRDERAASPRDDDFFGDEGDQLVQLRYAEGDVNKGRKNGGQDQARKGSARHQYAKNARPGQKKQGHGSKPWENKSREDKPWDKKKHDRRDAGGNARQENRADRDGNRKFSDRPDRDGNRAPREDFRKDGFKKRGFERPAGGHGKPGHFKKPGGFKKQRDHRAA
jgi:superfamily II DNA/RNA helicase